MDRFFIGPIEENSGLQTRYKSWVIPDQAFSSLENAYCWRGRVRKKFGSALLSNDPLLSRLRVNIGTVSGTTFTGNTPVINGGSVLAVPSAIGQMFSMNDVVFTVTALGTPATLLRSDGTGDTATFNTTTGAVVLNGVVNAADIYYYPSLPVMGLLSRETGIVGDMPTIAFDTRLSYTYNNGWNALGVTAGNPPTVDVASEWMGSDSQFFWGSNWSGTDAATKVFFVTNNNQTDTQYIRRLQGSTWTSFRPAIVSDSSLFLNNALILVPFKNRLLAFNTWEGADIGSQINYQNRLRYSQIGDPTATNAWYQDVPGLGNAIDAPITQAIVTVQFIRDQLVVYFEESAWQIIYTGNAIYPFAWQQVNSELGVESTFSIIPMDQVAIGVGTVGIIASTGSSVQRIDELIPDFVFDIHDTGNGPRRTYGIRDYYTEQLMWTLRLPPLSGEEVTFPYPNRVLFYNYSTKSWSINIDYITCFGYFQQDTAITWSSTTVTWSDPISWTGGPSQTKFKQIIAGNQEGFTFYYSSGYPVNASALQITNINVTNGVATVTCINHNLIAGTFIYITGITQSGAGNLTDLNNKIFKIIDNVVNPITNTTFSFVIPDALGIITGTYSGNGYIAVNSKPDIKTKDFNFYLNEGRNAYISEIDFLVDNEGTESGSSIQVNVFVDTDKDSLYSGSQIAGALSGSAQLDTFPYAREQNQSRFWHPVYMLAEGQSVLVQLTMTDEQMMDINVMNADFQLHAMCFHAMKSSNWFTP